MQRFVGRKKKNSMKFTEQKKRVEKKMVGTTIPPHQTKKKRKDTIGRADGLIHSNQKANGSQIKYDCGCNRFKPRRSRRQRA
jgi:hypothetical protein